ncbi:MAG: RND transporter [Gemmataceae bacterium]
MIMVWRSSLFVAISALVAGIIGCGSADSKTGQVKENGKQRAGQVKASAGDHSGWWCDEHGVPEAECSACDAKVAADFKKKGDWCDKHDRALSQCFVCTSKAKDRYAAIYRAKEGKEPPIEDVEKK